MDEFRDNERRTIRYVCMAPDVMLVAVINDKLREDTTPEWAAYIGAFERRNKYEDEAVKIAKHGTKVPMKIADHYFPFMDETHRWRA